MAHSTLAARIERALTEEAGLYVAVEEANGAIVLTGHVDSPASVRAAEDIVARIAPGARVDNNLDVETTVPEAAAEFNAEEPTHVQPPESVAEIEHEGADIAPDFTDQPLETTGIEDFVAEARDDREARNVLEETENVVVPPTDPVISTASGQAEVLGGFAPTSMDEQYVAPSAEDPYLGDEAIADAIRRELVEDATTTALRIDVEVRQGTAFLRGEVEGLEDADNAEAVASRVPGVREVREELRVRSV
ncbi:MAG TPA: BON domain-containing protein [Chloroflexota bacterium]|nr:BON domain-containing protein [Chloroflexota bacterium]